MTPTSTPADFARREADWRCGAVVYQVLVDRFAPSAALADKLAQGHYDAPRQLRDWAAVPSAGPYLAEHQVWHAETEFWGGDLQSLRARLQHIVDLGADTLYLNPIHLGWTNHKYDSLDFQQISPEFGSWADFSALAQDTHAAGLRLVVDGVFNHMGRNAPVFRAAEADPASPWRAWFNFGPQYATGVCTWAGAHNLIELNLEHPPVRDHLWNGPESVVRRYLRAGADGWRLDTAYELGRRWLSELTAVAHEEKADALVVGEFFNFPGDWVPAVDAVMNLSLRSLLLGLAQGRFTGPQAGALLQQLVAGSGLEALLRSWVMLDNHDLPRLATLLPDPAARRLAQALQFTVPGAPNLYYGAEVGMTGGDDPLNRAPMRWDLVEAEHPDLAWTRQLIALHRGHRALRIGDLRPIHTQRLFAFERHTDRALETRLVLANPHAEPITETLMIANADLMERTLLVDLLAEDPTAAVSVLECGFITITVPPMTVRVLQPVLPDFGGYTRYKRIP